MGSFEQLFGEFGLPARAIVALILVLALIALTVWLMRRFGDARGMPSSGGRGRQQRLAVLDSANVDARRRLVLIRRDNVEHLILIGGPTDVVIEPGIVRAQPVVGARAAPRGYENEDYEAPIVPETSAEAERPAPQPAPVPRAPSPEIPRPAPPAPRPIPRVDPQYADMAQRLDAALRKPQGEAQAAPSPRAPEPRAPQPPTARPAPQRPAEARSEPRPQQSEQAADVFSSLEEEMASLLRPAPRKDPDK